MAVSFTGYELVYPAYVPERERMQLSFGGTMIRANKKCLEALNGATYVHILVNRTLHRIVIEACKEASRDTFRWRTYGEKFKPKEIKCEPLTYLVYEMMGWNYGLKYSTEGIEEISESGEKIIVFNLDKAEVRDVVRESAKMVKDKHYETSEARGRTVELYDNFSIVEVPMKVKLPECGLKDDSQGADEYREDFVNE